MAKDKRSRLERAILPKGCGGPRMVVWAPISTPDWGFWQDMPKVELWQACALSLNLNPDSISPHYDGMGMMGSGLPSFRYENFPSAETWEEFEKRLRLAEANIHPQNAFCPNPISLSDFVRFVLNLSNPWDMPPELVVLAHKPETQISASVNDPLPIDDKELEAATDNYKEMSKNATEQSEPEIHTLFDPMYKKAITLLFDRVTELRWKELFNRAKRNGLKDIRETNGKYNPAKIAEWLVNKGAYTKEHVDRKLANNLPERSKDKKYLITGDLE